MENIQFEFAKNCLATSKEDWTAKISTLESIQEALDQFPEN